MIRKSCLLLCVVVGWMCCVQSLYATEPGTLVAWGSNLYDQCNVLLGNDYVAITGGSEHFLALKANGTLADTASLTELANGINLLVLNWCHAILPA